MKPRNISYADAVNTAQDLKPRKPAPTLQSIRVAAGLNELAERIVQGKFSADAVVTILRDGAFIKVHASADIDHLATVEIIRRGETAVVEKVESLLYRGEEIPF